MTGRSARWVGGGLLLLGLLLAWRLAAVAGAGGDDLPVDRGVGGRVANFTLDDPSGKPVSLYGFRGKKALVLVFLGTDCPVGNLYAPRLAELAHQFQDRGVVFLGVNANAGETAAQVAEHARAHGIDFPVLKDPGNRVADQLLVERTCETLVLDGQARLRYRGAIDDQYGVGTRKDAPATHYVRDALEAVLAGRTVQVAATPVAGCLLDRAEVKAAGAGKPGGGAPRIRPAAPAIVEALEEIEAKQPPVQVGSVTYAGDVAAIVQERCQSCHRPGQVAPFSLLTYDDARRHAAMIAEVVEDRRMPPWHADPRFGHFRNDRHLNPRERATLLAWVEQGTPLGDPSALPAPRTFPAAWSIGEPDMVFELPKPQTVAAQGTLDYVNVRVPTNFREDRWVQAAEAQPGDRTVVHHILVFVDDHSGTRRQGIGGQLCGYVPGDIPTVLPPGAAKKVPAGSDLLFQIHYTPTGTLRTDRSRVGLIFAKPPVEHVAHTHGIAQRRFLIPPGVSSHPVSSSFTFPADAHLLSMGPHMHVRGKSFEYKATYPDGTGEVLLSVPAYDFGWQTSYVLETPKAMPKGTRIDCLAHFDNSAANPANPDPNRAVTWGDQTFEEMMIGYIDYVDDAPIAAAAPRTTAAPRAPRR
jgi:peroxiredoxin